MRLICNVIAFLSVAIFGAFSTLSAEESSAKARVVTGADLIGGPFILVDHTGKSVTEKDFQGKHMLVFFGFTHCPYVCPVGLSTIAQVLHKLGDDAKLISPIFISIDPERDKVEVIADYIKKIDERIIGLTGEPDEIQKVADSYRAYFRKIQGEDKQNYQMDHSPIIYFMDEQGRFISYFTSEQGAEFISEEIKKRLSNK